MAEGDNKNLEEMTVADLRTRASELEITGRSSMNKEELVQAVADAEEQTAMMKANGGSIPANGSAKSESESDSKSESSDDSKTSSEDRPWRESSGDSEDASDMTAPSIGPNTTIENIPPEERLDLDEISDVDAMGLDKRRQVGGQRYGASPLKQLVVYGTFFIVLAALVIGGKIAADKLDQPPDTVAVKAPWAEGSQKAPQPIDFPTTTDPD